MGIVLAQEVKNYGRFAFCNASVEAAAGAAAAAGPAGVIPSEAEGSITVGAIAGPDNTVTLGAIYNVRRRFLAVWSGCAAAPFSG